MYSIRAALPLLRLALCLPTLALAQTVNVNVNAGTTIRVVDDRLFGANSAIWDSALGTAQTQSLLQAAGIRAIRLPGGSTSDEYHWRTNTNLDHDTIVGRWTWASGFDKSSALTVNLDANAMITVNYGTGTPQEAAAWVAYANFATTGGSDVTLGLDVPAPGTTALPTPGPFDWQTARTWASLRAATPAAGSTDADHMDFLRIGRTQPFGFKYWEIGNENYGNWESDLQSPAWDPTTYANRAAQYMTAMKSVDPTIKIGVVVVLSGQYNNWTQTVLQRLATLGKQPDFVIYHRYDGAPGQESDAVLLQSANTWQSDIGNLRALVNAAFGATNGASTEIIVTENNSVYSNPGKQSTSLVNGLFLADSLGNVMRTETKGFFWWDIRNGPPATSNNSTSLYGWRTYGDYGILSSQATGGSSSYYEMYPTYYAFKLLSYFARGGDTMIGATTDSNLVAAFAAQRTGGAYTILVINKNPSTDVDATINLTGITATNATFYTFGKANDDAAKPNATGCADITATSSTVAAGGFSHTFPAYSMSVVWLGAGAPAAPAVAPAFVTNPTAVTLTAGATASFSGGASGCPAVTYQWQRAPSGSSTYTDLTDGGAYSGTSTATLTVASTTTTMSGDQFRLVAGNGASSVNSTSATLTVAAASGSGSGGGSGGGGGGGGAMDLVALALLGSLALDRARRRIS